MRKILAGVMIVLLFAMHAEAQAVVKTGSITAISTGGACAEVGACVTVLDADRYSAVTVTVSGTFTGTLTFESSSDSSVWFALTGIKQSDFSPASSTTITGQFSFANPGFAQLRVKATAAMTGAATITFSRGFITPHPHNDATGATSDSTGYAFRIRNASGNNLFNVLNDGTATWGTSQAPLTSPIPNAFYVTGSVNTMTMQRNDPGENRFSLISTGTGVIDYSTIYMFRRHYTFSGGVATHSPMNANDVLGAYAFRGTRNATGSVNSQTGIGLLAWANELWSDTANGTKYILRGVLKGTTTQWAGYQMDSDVGNAFSGGCVASADPAFQVTAYSGSGGGALGARWFLVACDGTVKTESVWSGPASSVLTIASNTVVPTGALHHVGAGLIKSITVPTSCSPTCTIALVPDAAFTTDTTGNISLVSLAVINRVMLFVWDGSKWNPSY